MPRPLGHLGIGDRDCMHECQKQHCMPNTGAARHQCWTVLFLTKAFGVDWTVVNYISGKAAAGDQSSDMYPISLVLPLHMQIWVQLVLMQLRLLCRHGCV